MQNDPEVIARREGLGEVIGGGYIVIGRKADMRLNLTQWPFEWGTREAALAEAERLAALFPSKGFCVFQLTDGIVHGTLRLSNPVRKDG
jgi:hypothetical protein